MTPDQREDYEERAAIMEYDGNLTRPQAEQLARFLVLKQSCQREMDAIRRLAPKLPWLAD